MNIFYEAKLSTKDRNNLDEDEFGLPSERRYPLNDESHVRSAIMFFKYADKNKKKELAKNINKKLDYFNMKVKVDKENPFYSYMNKKYLSESMNDVVVESVIPESDILYAEKQFPKDLRYIYNELIHYDKINAEDMNIKEHRFYDSFKSKIYDSNIKYSLEVMTNFFLHINKTFDRMYDELMKYLDYSEDKTFYLYYSILSDIFNGIVNKINSENFDIDKDLDTILYIQNNMKNPNHYYVYRWLVLIRYYFNDLQSKLNFGKQVSESLINKINGIIVETEKMINHKCSSVYPESDMPILFASDFSEYQYNRTVQILELVKQQMDMELRAYGSSVFNTDTPYEIRDNTLYDKFQKLKYFSIISDRFNFIHEGSPFSISDISLVRLSKIDGITATSRLTQDKCDLWIVCRFDKLNVLIEYNDNQTIGLMELTDELVNYLDGGSYRPKVLIHKFTFVRNDMIINKSVTEGITVDADGNIKISIKKIQSYMDEYSEAHRILAENYKNKNYEAMKRNVAFMFSLISRIEKDNRYKKRDPELVKARAFAINDFKTYLKYIQSYDYDYDFVKYYKDNNYDKLILNLPKETIIGIKKLFQAIIVS